MKHCITILLLSSIFGRVVCAEPLTVAVASNFAGPAQEIVARYEETSGEPVRMVTASTGTLYAQIGNGAPFDVLLAADMERPQLLELSGFGVTDTRFTYAIGSLVLWSGDPALSNVDCKALLADLDERRLAIANPQTAPYGTAAMQFLQAAELWEAVKSRLVFGENISQTLQFVATGNATLGLIARSQTQNSRLPTASCFWPVPESMHEPIQQQAILLQFAGNNEAAKNFLSFLRGINARKIITDHGYTVPQ